MEYRKYRRNLKARLVNFFAYCAGYSLHPWSVYYLKTSWNAIQNELFFFMRKYRNYLEQCARVDHQEDTVGSRGTPFELEKKKECIWAWILSSPKMFPWIKLYLFRFQNYFPVSCKRVNALVWKIILDINMFREWHQKAEIYSKLAS